jgi:hypothetical protein
MFLTILSRGFQIMAAGIILALSGGAFVLFAMWALVAFADRNVHMPTQVAAKACPAPDYMTSSARDVDAQGAPTAEGLLRRMYRLAPTC